MHLTLRRQSRILVFFVFFTWGNSPTLMTWWVYLLRVELVSLPLTNPPAMVLSVSRTVELPSPWDASLDLLGLRLQASSRPCEFYCSDWLEETHFTSWSGPPVSIFPFPYLTSSDYWYDVLLSCGTYTIFQARPGGMWCWDVVHVECLAPDMFSTGVQRHKTPSRLSNPFEHGFIFYGLGITFFPWGLRAHGAENMLLDVTSLLLRITFVAFDITLCAWRLPRLAWALVFRRGIPWSVFPLVHFGISS